jgi:methylthioribose-1-phosphate isomerase
MPQELRAVDWTGNSLALIDQTVLPHRTEIREIRDVDALVDAIQRLVVRGAPAIGAAGAYGVALALSQGEREGWSVQETRAAVARVRAARPTAVNLMVCVDRVMARFDEGLDAVLAEAAAVQREDVEANRAMGAYGADWLLKTVEVVYADETRPLLQGSRLTAWELVQEGIPHYVQADGAAAGTILRGEVDAAIVGADRIAANGDTANKVGTVGVALACADAGIPFLVAAPTTTVDLTTATGADIHIELRGEDEVLEWSGIRTAPTGSRGHNPAFDVTPGRLVTGLVTERGVLEISAGELPGDHLK